MSDRRRAGAGPVLMLHGQPGGARDWDQVSAAIGAVAQPIVLERPGWDGSTPATGLEGNAAAALAALDAREVSSATVVGHSFGAAVACWLAISTPERVRSLLLLAPCANLASLYRWDRWLAAGWAGYLTSAAGLELAGIALGARAARHRIASVLALEDPYLEAAGRLLRSPASWRSFTVEQRALVHDLPLLEARLGEVRAPTKVVIGSRDWVLPAGSAQQLAAQIPRAELLVLERAGHLLPLQRAREIAELIG